jgi:hypothetical protein
MKVNRSVLLLSAAMLAVSCAHSPPSGEPAAAAAPGLAALYPPQASDRDGSLEITARVRLDVPKYRIRGSCGIHRFAGGALQIDFTHSSLFGSYREDVSILVRGDSITIIDHVRGEVRGTEETIELVSEYFDFKFAPADIAAFLLLDVPGNGEWDECGFASSGNRWMCSGDWKGRTVELEGILGRGPVIFRVCAPGGGSCYETRYGYRSGGEPAGYPKRIVVERRGGPERISISIESVESTPGISRVSREKK